MSIIKKSAIVTGGGSGMGAATAEKLIQNGWNVTIFGRTQSKLDDTLKSINKPDQILAVAGDVSNPEDVEKLINAHVERFGGLDGLVNSAGIAIGGPVGEVTLEDFKQVMSINVEGVFHTVHHATPHLKKSGGSIVNVSSVSGIGGDWGFSPYNASKGAVSNYTRALALELGGQGVRVNAVAPTLTDTDMGSFLTESEEMMALFKSRTPLGRAAKPNEVASAIAFLLSEEASFINGVNLPIDGGVSASNGQPNFFGV
ncbi:SDR family NAD(P)-dependent oxidoreductase [Marinomonas pollencensis]|uniref:Meso-butanediol dehydrogenase/(S,S)-butanediol dehydrogenase/diacetyl reductase n=1 Tax=Marinomonas pollencensis TaxID=491954 RepID=A0A3E0DHI6_9GAMM|nr:SDR family oxidoreductase [Marinomonas pollencensis]REG82142.1 meso-butanediol dehydrogenase/(S,S)-butanediol dehydrogenase/diacetyl reductase [Marinomonas pollencensis]